MFTNEQIDKLLTMYKDNGKEIGKTGGKILYSTVLRGQELLSVRKDLVKKDDRLVIGDQETLAIITSVDSIVRSRGLVQFRKVFPEKFNQVLSQSSVYLGDLGKPIDVVGLFHLLVALKTTVKRLKTYNRVSLTLSDEIVEQSYGVRLSLFDLMVLNNRIVSKKYTKALEYILDNDYNQNFYKILTMDKRVLSLTNIPLNSEYDVRRHLMEKVDSKNINEIKEEIVSCLTKANEFDRILSFIVTETGNIINDELTDFKEVNRVVELISDSERLLQDCIEQDLSGISSGFHSDKLARLTKGKAFYKEFMYDRVRSILNMIYTVGGLQKGFAYYDLDLALNEAMYEYGRDTLIPIRKLDYYGHLVGASDDGLLLTEDEAEALKDLSTLIHELFMYVYKNEGKLVNA